MALDLAFLEDKPTPVWIGDPATGKSVNFYPVDLETLHTIKGMARPISNALSVLFSKEDSDTGRQWNEFADSQAGQASTKTIIEPIAPELAKFRSNQRAEAISQLMDCLTDNNTHDILVGIVLASMKEEFPLRPKRGTPPFNEIKSKISVPRLLELFKGVMAANGDFFRPLVEKVTDAMRREASPPSPLQQSQASQNQPQGASEIKLVRDPMEAQVRASQETAGS